MQQIKMVQTYLGQICAKKSETAKAERFFGKVPAVKVLIWLWNFWRAAPGDDENYVYAISL